MCPYDIEILEKTLFQSCCHASELTKQLIPSFARQRDSSRKRGLFNLKAIVVVQRIGFSCFVYWQLILTSQLTGIMVINHPSNLYNHCTKQGSCTPRNTKRMLLFLPYKQYYSQAPQVNRFGVATSATVYQHFWCKVAWCSTKCLH